MIDGQLWDRPDDDSAQARERSRLYNTSTLLTLTVGVVICYLALYVVNLVWALFVLDPAVMGGSLGTSIGYDDLFVFTWFVASVATSPAHSARAWSRTKRSARRHTRNAKRSAAPVWRTSGPRRPALGAERRPDPAQTPVSAGRRPVATAWRSSSKSASATSA